MLLALVLAILVRTRCRSLEALAVNGVELFTRVSGAKVMTTWLTRTYPEEGVVLFPSVVRAGRALSRVACASLYGVRGYKANGTHDLLEVGAEVGVIDLDGSGGLGLSHDARTLRGSNV